MIRMTLWSYTTLTDSAQESAPLTRRDSDSPRFGVHPFL